MPSTKNQDYVVEKIVSKRTDNKGRIFYLIKWKGYSTSDNSWEPENHVNNCQDLIKEYEAEQAQKNKSKNLTSNKSEGRTNKRSTRTNLSPTKKSNNQNGRSTRSSNRPSSTRQDYKRAFSNDSNSTDEDNGYTGEKLIKSLSTKRTRKITIDTDSIPSTDSRDTDLLDTTKLEKIVDVRRNKNNTIDYQIQVKKIKKSVWIKSDQLTEDYAQQVVDFLEEKYV